MADVDVNIYQSVTNKEGVSTPVMGVIVGDPLPNPINPNTGSNYLAGEGLSLLGNTFKLGDADGITYNAGDQTNLFYVNLLNLVDGRFARCSQSTTPTTSSSSISSNKFISGGGDNRTSSINMVTADNSTYLNIGTVNNSDSNKEIGFYISDNNVSSEFTAKDEVNLKGIEYAADYSANYTNRSLVDKEYVDGLAGGIPPIDGSYASEAAMIADQVNQTAQYIYYDGTAYWEYLGTTTPSIADYRQIGGGSSSKWTDATGGIYRDGNVTIGQTALPTAGGAEYQTFSVKSKVSGASGNNIFSSFQKSDGTEIIRLSENSPVLNLLPYSANEAVTIGNITSFSGARGLVIRPNSAGQSIICTDTAGTVNRFSVGASGELWNTNVASFGNVVVGTTINAWGVGVKGFGNNNAARMNFVVQRSTGTVDFQVASNGDILTNGNITIADAKNFILNATTGTKIGTATSQKLAFWNKTPIIQPTTAITGATLAGGGGTTITDTHTFGGYTLQQIAAALINIGILT